MKSLKYPSLVLVVFTLALATVFSWGVQTAVANIEAGCQPNITVTSNADSGPGTLRQAILDVCAGGVIDFDLPWPANITLTSEQLLVDKAMHIEGPGANLLSIRSGLPFTRVLQNDGEGVLLTGMTIRDGSPPYYDGEGGGILNTGVLTITGLVLQDNKADSHLGYVKGGGIANVGGTLTLNDSALIGNTAGGGGGD
ncbi:MAG: hypothetical protein Fur0021_08250 [Candidatus Promineifilaceae bacterium]